MYKGYRVRLFPSQEQEELMWKHIHACRFIWNYMIEMQEKNFKDGGSFMHKYDMINMITPLKKQEECSWLGEVSRDSLNITCIDLEKSYIKFFKHINGHPKFKSRKTAKPIFPVSQVARRVYATEDGYFKIPIVGCIKYKTNLNIPIGIDKKYTNPRISLKNNKWFISFEVDCENQAVELTDVPMGIDLGLKDLAIVAFGDQKIVFHNINHSKKMRNLEKKKKYIQRVIHRKYRTNKSWDKTNGIIKYEKMLSEIQQRIVNIRKNYIHQSTHALINLSPKYVVMEDLDIVHMEQNKYIASDVFSQCLGEFLRQMEYKCDFNGIPFVKADRWYPSSKTCSNCGAKKKKLKWSERTFHCHECGISIDRDYNAAINLMRYVSHLERLTA